MTNEEMMSNVKDWQEDEMTHELTCGKDSSHKALYPVEKLGKIILKCYDCDYIQNWVPDCVLNFNKEKSNKISKALGASTVRVPKGNEKSFI